MKASRARAEAALSPLAAEFAPGLLAIQDTAPPPLPRVVLHVVSALFLLMLLWAALAQVDVVAVAEGRLVPHSLTKIVQPAEAGIVRELLVHEGDAVRHGQVLVRLDATVAGADRQTLAQELALKRLALRRIDAELRGVDLAGERDDDAAQLAQVKRQLLAQRQAHADALAQEHAALQRIARELQAAQATLAKLEATAAIATDAAAMHRQLLDEGFISLHGHAQKQREAIEQSQDLKSQAATVESLVAALAAQRGKLAALGSQYRKQLLVERTEVVGALARLEQEAHKSVFRADLTELRAPQDGVVKDLATTTVGAVVQPGMVLLTLVPRDDTLEAEVQVRNDDVGFVRAGMPAQLKVAAYPFQKYGLLQGRVKGVSPDAQAPDAARSGGVPQAYKAVIALDEGGLRSGGERLRLEPGMVVQAEVHEGRRTVLEYLLSPVRAVVHEAGRER